MATDYNASLIADLYTTTNVEKATHIADEMAEIGDAIFPRQIYEAYKKFKQTSLSHYFVSDLVNFKSTESADILKEIALTTDREADVAMMIDFLIDIEYFDSVVVNKVKGLFIGLMTSEDISEYDIESYFRYLEKSKEDIQDLGLFLKSCFESEKQSMSARKMALKKFLKLDPKSHLKYYLDNYDSIKGKKAEIIFADEISTWRNGIVPVLHVKILKDGSARAKEILEGVQKKKEEDSKDKQKEEQKEIKEEYSAADVVNEIAKGRSAINTFTSVDGRFGFAILAPSEEIYQQGQLARTKESLVGYCIVLRSVFGGFNQQITDFQISDDKAKELLPDIVENKGSINKFHLYVLDKGIKADQNLWGLRNLNRIVSKFAHPTQESSTEFVEILKTEGLDKIYADASWSLLHREILLRYKAVLEKTLLGLKGNPVS